MNNLEGKQIQENYKKQSNQIDNLITKLAKENLRKISENKKTYYEVLREVQRNRPISGNSFQQSINNRMMKIVNEVALSHELNLEDFN